MKTYLHTILAIFVILICAACSSPEVINQQPYLFRIAMAESATGTIITFNDTVMSLNEIGRALSAEPKSKNQPRVLLLIDPKVPTAMYFDAMDMLRKVGMDESAAVLKWGDSEPSAHIVTSDENVNLIQPYIYPSDANNADEIKVEIK